MIKNIEKRKRLYYQKYLPGDIITPWYYDHHTISELNENGLIRLVTGVIGTFGNFRYETMDIELGRSRENSYYEARKSIMASNVDIENSRLIFRPLLGTSDVICKEVCKFSEECDLCNFKPSISPNKFFFPGDKVNSTQLVSYPVDKRKGIVKRVRINTNNILIEFVEELNRKDNVTLDFVKKRIKELVNFETLEYRVFMGYSSVEVSHFPDKLRLFQRRCYTVDPGKLSYCSQCILPKNECDKCGMMEYNLLDNSKLLEI